MNNSLMVLNTTEFDLMMKQAEIIAKSGLVPKAVATPERVLVIMMTGRELGMPPMTALRCIDVINGAPAVKPQGMMALIERSGQVEDFRVEDDGETCTVTMKRKGRTEHGETFSMADAQRMMTTEWEGGQSKRIPLADKYNWKQMPAIMRKWRAIAACARVVFPDVILGLYTTEELGDESTIIEGELVDDKSEPPLPPAVSAPRPTNGAEKPEREDAEKSAPALTLADVVKAASPQTPEQRRIPSGDEGDKPTRRNLKTAEIADLKAFVISISPKVQADKAAKQDMHAAGSIKKALGVENWAQLTIALDNEVEELAAVRARVQAYVEAEHVMTRPLEVNTGGDDTEPDALPKASGQ